jgi:hypothetical protein
MASVTAITSSAYSEGSSATFTSKSNSNSKPSMSVGEELFLVHLKRDEHMHDDPETDDDIDLPPPHQQRQRSKSIGEELYEVHVRRSNGLTDKDDDEADVNAADDVDADAVDHEGDCDDDEENKCVDNDCNENENNAVVDEEEPVPTLTPEKQQAETNNEAASDELPQDGSTGPIIESEETKHVKDKAAKKHVAENSEKASHPAKKAKASTGGGGGGGRHVIVTRSRASKSITQRDALLD